MPGHNLLAVRMKRNLDIAIAAGRYIEAASPLLGEPYNPVRPDMLEAQEILEDVLAARTTLAMTDEELQAMAKETAAMKRDLSRLARRVRFLTKLATFLFGDLREARQKYEAQPLPAASDPEIAVIGMVITLICTALWRAAPL